MKFYEHFPILFVYIPGAFAKFLQKFQDEHDCYYFLIRRFEELVFSLSSRNQLIILLSTLVNNGNQTP